MSQWLLRQMAASCVALLSALTLPAQRLTVNPSSVLVPGTTVTIDYWNPSLANTDVTIEVQGGFPSPTTERIVMRLDKAGKGRGYWIVNPYWLTAGFNAPGCSEIGCLISR